MADSLIGSQRSAGITGSRTWAFGAAAGVLFVLYTGNNMPGALYGLLRAEYGFSPLTQTLLYTTAVVVIVPALVVFGPLSDAVGRRAPLVLGLAAFAAGDLLFAVATDSGALFAARAFQGLGMGAATAAAQAALADTAGWRGGTTAAQQRLAARVATACVTFGLAAGPLLGGLLAQWAPAPERLPFVVHVVLVAVVAALVLTAPPGWRTRTPGTRPRLARLGVPPKVRGAFAAVGSSSFLAWGVLGMFSGVLPSTVGDLLGGAPVAVTAGALTLMIAISGVVQLGAHRFAPRAAQVAGLLALAVGLGLLVAFGVAAPHLALLALAMIVTGAGHGLVYAGGTAELTAVTPAEHRGAVIGTYFVTGYVGLGGPVVVVGLAAVSHGLLAAASAMVAVLCVLLVPFLLPVRGRR
jgi:MFS family permease